jgi:hypothetical protein
MCSTAGAASAEAPLEPNIPEAASTNCPFQAVIWFGCTSYCCANSASVFSPLMAASATFALKAAAWVRRTRLVIVTPDPRHPRCFQADFPLIELSEFGRPPLHRPEGLIRIDGIGIMVISITV